MDLESRNFFEFSIIYQESVQAVLCEATNKDQQMSVIVIISKYNHQLQIIIYSLSSANYDCTFIGDNCQYTVC